MANACKIIVAAIGCIGVVLAGVLGSQAAKLPEERSDSVPDSEFVVHRGSAGAVATDDKRCSKAGLKVLKKGGNAVDAAVASLLCLGVVNFQSSGIGGGLTMLVAKKNTSSPTGYTVTVIDAREVAPNSSRESDYMPVNPQTGKHNYTSDTGMGSVETVSLTFHASMYILSMTCQIVENGIVCVCVPRYSVYCHPWRIERNGDGIGSLQ